LKKVPWAVGLLNVSQAGLDMTSGGAGDLLFSQSDLVCGTYVQVGIQSVEVFILFGAYFL
jgi:hypothetical protein